MKPNVEEINENIKKTEWVDIPLEQGFSNYAEWTKCQAKRVGDMVYIVGTVKGFTSINYTKFASLPKQFRTKSNDIRQIQVTRNDINEVSNQSLLAVSENSGDMMMTKANFDVTADTGININCTYCI